MESKWRLESITIKFQKGYSFREKEEEKHDRYEGRIEFKNGDEESFNLNIPIDMTNRYMELMKDDIIKTAETLGAKLAESININNDKESI